jgi:hypothetical protein
MLEFDTLPTTQIRMYRCGWGTKDKNQTNILAVTLTREGFESLVSTCWPSSFGETAVKRYNGNKEEWQAAKSQSGCVLQWDPDHNPDGSKHPGRRAMQLGIRPALVSSVFNGSIVQIEDITPFVAVQRRRLEQGLDFEMPYETEYVPLDLNEFNQKLGLDVQVEGSS